MITTKSTFSQAISVKNLPFDLNQSILFDIETTGFMTKNSKIYMIGVLYCSKMPNQFEIIQFFCDDGDEKSLLTAFFTFIRDFKYIVHFNGTGFDIPFLLSKCEYYHLPFHFGFHESFDLYKEACSLKHFIQTENKKQKTLEAFFGLNREDAYSGGELINVYHDFTKETSKEKKEQLSQLLHLHNAEDLKGMLVLFEMFDIRAVLSGDFSYTGHEFHEYKSMNGTLKKEIYFSFKLNNPLTVLLSAGNEYFYVIIHKNELKLRVSVRNGELKYFYPDYKNYYYLPKEDLAIHKSVAFYVDKNFRTQAKAANCYSRKSGVFLPEYDEIICPYFKAEYRDSVLYFEVDSAFLDNGELVKKYAVHLLSSL